MKETEKKRAAKAFAEFWKDKGYEKGESQTFWMQLLQNVFGVEDIASFIQFEVPVKIDRTKFIDGYIPSTQVLIEQKGKDVDLTKEYPQSDGRWMTPYRQAREYAGSLAHNMNPRWIIVCNFHTFELHDMNHPNDDPEVIHLSDFEKEYHRLQFLVEEKNEILRREHQVSIDAGRLVGKLYNALLNQYVAPNEGDPDEAVLKDLNRLCVRLVFCLYAEDAGIFGGHNKFHDYIKKVADKDIDDVREALIKLFEVLNQPQESRSRYLKPELAAFPYVNGGLFKDEAFEIPNFTHEIVDLLLHNASEDFDWSQISPTIFGALFESTLNPVTRRAGGMHYTSIENIHKVIDPLFLDELREELKEISSIKVEKIRNGRLNAFREKLGSLTFFDPACGSGNFLTEAYLSLRRLENKALELMQKGGQINFDLGDVIKVSIGQFYGIEINDFAVTVARTALWIAESQMMKETEELLQINLDFLPLKSYANIVEGNALRIDWETVVPKDKLNYIMGNPPFVGQTRKTKEQSYDMAMIFGSGSSETKLDYVICWYKKAIRFMKNTTVNAAFVSTNSICQGETVPTFWKNMIKDGAEIQFAHNHFKWTSDSTEAAAVYCVIVGFSMKNAKKKKLYNEQNIKVCDHINAYLIAGPDIWLESRGKQQEGMQKLQKGSEPSDGGNLFLTKQDKEGLVKKHPALEKYIKPFIGATEFLNVKNGEFTRFCFWFKDSYNPSDLRGIKEIENRFSAIKEKRANSSADRIRKMAEKPYLFSQIRQPESTYIVIPETTTSNRKYVPMGFFDSNVIAGNSTLIAPNMTLYHFGILISNVHMAWMRIVCGRMGMGYRYSPAVYNNFPWPVPTAEQKAKIERTAQEILDARALYPDCSLADLYDETIMPSELRDAHKANDRAVAQAYGFKKAATEDEYVEELMRLYKKASKE